MCLALAGCAGGVTNSALLEPRTIDVDTTAEPAGGIISSHIQQLQAKTGPSYVTLVVHEKQGRHSAKVRDHAGRTDLRERLRGG
jgi:hypothetical protein